MIKEADLIKETAENYKRNYRYKEPEREVPKMAIWHYRNLKTPLTELKMSIPKERWKQQ